MYVNRIQLTNFRNFQSLDLKIDQGFIVLHGDNGAGKTNFLESIYFAASLRRFPESSLGQLFYERSNFFRNKLVYKAREEEMLELTYERTEKGFHGEYKVNGQETSRPKYAGLLPAVSFLPQDLNLLTRSPSGRRRYMDETLCMLSAEYRHHLARYDQAVRQRNELLGKIVGGLAPQGLEVWDEQLVEHGSQLTAEREKLFQYLNTTLPAVLRSVSVELSGVEFLYRNSGLSDPKQYSAALSAMRRRELVTGVTALGPHRDDFEAQISGQRAAGYLSRGQLRSITLTLKILEKQYIEQRTGRQPIILLDDVFSEFDSAHQRKLVEFLSGLKQAFLTTAHLEEVKDFLPAAAQLFRVDNGKILS